MPAPSDTQHLQTPNTIRHQTPALAGGRRRRHGHIHILRHIPFFLPHDSVSPRCRFGAGDPITDTVAPEQNKEGPEAAGNVTGGAEPPGYALCREQGNDDGVLVEEHDYDDGAHAAATAQDFEMRERDMRASKILALEHALANDIRSALCPISLGPLSCALATLIAS